MGLFIMYVIWVQTGLSSTSCICDVKSLGSLGVLAKRGPSLIGLSKVICSLEQPSDHVKHPKLLLNHKSVFKIDLFASAVFPLKPWPQNPNLACRATLPPRGEFNPG